MIKRLIFLFTALILCALLMLPTLATEYGDLLYDGACLLDSEQESELTSRLERIRAEFGVDVAIATVNGTDYMLIDRYVEKYFDENGLGYGAQRDGVLLVVDMTSRNYRILSNGENLGAAAISPDVINSLSTNLEKELSNGDYADAFYDYVDECEYHINGYINGYPFNVWPNLGISLAIGLLVAFAVTGVMRSGLKSVKSQRYATAYVKRDTLVLNESKDIFLYKNVQKINGNATVKNSTR